MFCNIFYNKHVSLFYNKNILENLFENAQNKLSGKNVEL